VSVIVPFFGDRTSAELLLVRLRGLKLAHGDEILVLDNTDGRHLASETAGPTPRVVAAQVQRSAYAARNEGIELARNDWVLLLDADCRPPADLLDRYFRRRVASNCGAVAGGIRGARGQSSLAARYGRARELLGLQGARDHPHLPAAVTANLLLRRSAWSDVGGFSEGMRASGADTELSWRIQEAGWSLCFDEEAQIEHEHRDSVPALLRQVARNSAGVAWLQRVRPGTLRRPRLSSGLARAAVGAAGFLLSGRPERASFKLLDGLVIMTENVGRLADNTPPYSPPTGSGAATVLVLDSFPEAAEIGSLTTLTERHPGLLVEAQRRADRPAWREARGLPTRFWEDDGAARRIADTVWLIANHPLRCLEDRRMRERSGAKAELRALAPAVRRLAQCNGRPTVLGGSGMEAARVAALLGSEVSEVESGGPGYRRAGEEADLE